MIKDLEIKPFEECLMQLSMLSLEKRKPRGSIFRELKGGCVDDGASLLPLALESRTRNSWVQIVREAIFH